ncbi:MAG: DUF2878 domain-containing protein [Planctomycetota bacterium]
MKIVNFVSFQIGWFACVLGSAYGQPVVGVVIAFALIALHFGLAGDRRAESVVVIAATALGWVAESLYHRFGLTTFDANGPWLATCPLWMVMIWALFGTTLNSSLEWLQSRRWLAAAFGAGSGPLAYFGGERLGALRLSDDRVAATLAIATTYTIALPVLLTLANRVRQQPMAGPGGRP